MSGEYNLCIIKPNKNAFSETFITEHINRLKGNKKVLYGGSFPVYDEHDKFLIRSKIKLAIYIIQKRIFKSKNIQVRNQALTNYLKANKIDVVFAEYGTVGAMVTQACKAANVPLVVNFHGADAHHQPTVNENLPFYKSLFEYASGIVVVSHDMADALIALGAPKDKIHWNPCGVDTNLFKALNLTKTQPNYLSVGRFVAKKSPCSVIRAFNTVAKAIPDAHLTMVGNGPLLDEAQALVNKLMLQSRVDFPGVLPSAQIIELFKQTRCFVQHSVTTTEGDKEGTPVTILEAGASGLAIVSTLHAGIKQSVINNQTGYLIPEHDIEAMAKHMIDLGNDVALAQQLGTKEAAHIRQNFDIKDRISTLDNIIKMAVQQNISAKKNMQA
jgi:colanic acid/amylovoran biosynthesis glycosyltransferase